MLRTRSYMHSGQFVYGQNVGLLQNDPTRPEPTRRTAKVPLKTDLTEFPYKSKTPMGVLDDRGADGREKSRKAETSGVTHFISRRSMVIFIPNFGRKVTSGRSATGWLGSKRMRQCCASVATSKVPSIQAKASPMHCLEPPPKGK